MSMMAVYILLAVIRMAFFNTGSIILLVTAALNNPLSLDFSLYASL